MLESDVEALQPAPYAVCKLDVCTLIPGRMVLLQIFGQDGGRAETIDVSSLTNSQFAFLSFVGNITSITLEQRNELGTIVSGEGSKWKRNDLDEDFLDEVEILQRVLNSLHLNNTWTVGKLSFESRNAKASVELNRNANIQFSSFITRFKGTAITDEQK